MAIVEHRCTHPQGHKVYVFSMGCVTRVGWVCDRVFRIRIRFFDFIPTSSILRLTTVLCTAFFTLRRFKTPYLPPAPPPPPPLPRFCVLPSLTSSSASPSSIYYIPLNSSLSILQVSRNSERTFSKIAAPSLRFLDFSYAQPVTVHKAESDTVCG